MGALMNILPIIIFFGLLIFSSLISAVVRRLSGWNKIYVDVAKRYGGQVYPGYLFSRPSMTFNYGRTTARLVTRKTTRFPECKMTELSVNWPDKRFKLEITSSPSVASRTWSLGRASTPVEIVDCPFNSILSIKSNRPELASAMLTKPVQWQIEQLLHHLNNGQLSININKGKLVVSKPTFIKDFHQLDDFVRFSLDMFDQLMLTESHGIEFVTRDEPTIVEDVVCPICSESIAYQTVVCVRCKTPHCLDCWQYNGQCATFACNETRYIRANGEVANH